jgi:hypothetical protein
MRAKLFLFAAAAAVCFFTAPMEASADHVLCNEPQAQWNDLLQSSGSLADVSSFRANINARYANICQGLIASVEQRRDDLTRRQQEQERLRAEVADRREGAQAELTALNRRIADETAARRRAENQINLMLRQREEEEAAERIPGRQRTLLACLISQDVARFDRGNIPGTQIERFEAPPEVQVVYDIQDAAQGAIDVYDWDLTAHQWTRNRIAAQLVGQTLTVGATLENDENGRVKSRGVINLEALSMNGAALFEPINAGGQSAINVDRNGQANLNLGALMQRPPRVWLETRGNCAYQSGSPPGPLTSQPEWRVIERAIPTVPPVPRR